MADLKELLALMARALADEPDAVQVTEGSRRNGAAIELQVASRDLGRIIGRQGRTAAALRTVLAAAAELDDQHVTLDIRDQSGRS